MSVPLIVHAEDNRVAARAVQRALRKISVDHELQQAADGVEGLRLIEAAAHAGRTPVLVLLDLNLLRLSGQELLTQVRTNPTARHLPVIVLSTSAHRSDVDAARYEGVSGYLCKDRLGAGMSELGPYLVDWFQKNVLPTEARA